MADVTSEPKPFNPFEPGFAEDPYPQYAELSAGNPVQQTPLGLWMLFGYDDAVRLLRDPSLSVEDRSVVGRNPRAELREQILGDRPERGTRRSSTSTRPTTPACGSWCSRCSHPGWSSSWRPGCRRWSTTPSTRSSRGEGMDVIADLAFPLPFQVISDMLGMPVAEEAQLRDWAHTLTLGLEPLLALQHLDEILDASDHMIEHVLDAIEWKRTHPADDLLSALIAAEDDGDRLSPDELLDQVILLYIAGHETTVNLIGNGTHALLTHRSQLERWRDDPALDANAVDELLRYDSPVQFSRRITTSALQVGDATIERGVFVLTCLAAANHDPGKWGATAQDLDLARPGAAQHLAFGSGIHHCLGAALARLEGRIALGTLIRRFPGLEPAGDTPAWNGRLVLRGLDSLPVILGS